MTKDEVPDLPTAQDRILLRDSLRGFLARVWPVDSAVPWSEEPLRVQEVSTLLALQGVTALGSDPSSGGLAEIVLTMEELGRASCRAPVLGAILLNLACRSSEQLSERLEARLRPLRAGQGLLALAFGAVDPDRGAGAASFASGRVSGTVRFVEGAASASHFAVAVSESALAFVAADDPAVRILGTRTMDAGGLCELHLQQVPATCVELGSAAMLDLLAVARLAHAARALGAASRAFELVVEYARERVQFGKPVGSFQAVQHKLANCHIALRSVRLSIENAALQFDASAREWRWYGAAAAALASSSLRQISLETHHAFGAIGYSEEHEAPRHFRAVHFDSLRYGATRQTHEELASHFLDRGNGFPVYDLGPAGNDFRLEVRTWLAQNWSGERKRLHESLPFKEREFDPEFALDLGKTGWIGLSWPERFGGQQRSTLEQLAFIEEMERVDAPRVGAPVQAVMLQIFGTPAQQAKYLPEFLRGQAMCGMGYSEPQAGSDLASLKTRAVRDGDHFVINGQKIWTTTYWGKYMLLATRTRSDAKPAHAGLSMFIVPMSTPGIKVHTSNTLYGGTFANVFYDDVRVPADAMIGAEGDGWKVLTGALATERGLVGGGIVLKVAHLFELLCTYLREESVATSDSLCKDPMVRSRMGELASQIEAARQMMLHCARALDDGNMDLADAAVSKVYSGELMERFGEYALEILGMLGTISQHGAGAILNGRIEQSLRHSLMWVISIGTNEIQRSLIAQRALGLPRQ